MPWEEDQDVIPLPDSDWNDYRTLRQGGPSGRAEDLLGTGWQMEYNFVTLTNEKGELMGKMFTFHDISEKARAEIAEANAGRLEAIGTLAGGIAHDFNNVMTSMMGELYLLRSEIDNSEGSMQRSRERINDMEMAMDRAKFVAQGLLSLAKGGAPIQKPTNLRELLDDTSRLAFTGSSITWSLDCPDDIWAVNIDQGQMNRAFLNILFNAQEASRERGRWR
jgi:signal transduction histidine kinase